MKVLVKEVEAKSYYPKLMISEAHHGNIYYMLNDKQGIRIKTGCGLPTGLLCAVDKSCLEDFHGTITLEN